FQKWLDQHNCYIFTINGFPYGRFHGARVKEQVYGPDWTPTNVSNTRTGCSICSPSSCPKGSKAASARFPARSKPSSQLPSKCAPCGTISGAVSSTPRG